jgi:predicted nucleic acid-binding protein
MERKTLRIVIDTNEFVFALTGPAASAPLRLLETLVRAAERFEVRIPQTVVTECARNLPTRARPRLFALLNALASIDPDYVVPFETGERYRAVGMKAGDALIAAYCDWIEADVLLSENRHFLLDYRQHLPFEVLTAEHFLQEFGGSEKA